MNEVYNEYIVVKKLYPLNDNFHFNSVDSITECLRKQI
jgi:hypothetical protein